VLGLRLNLATSDNLDVTGLDLGLVGKARRMNAVQVNLGNLVEAEFAGIEAGLYNRTGSLTGLQAGLFNRRGADLNGFQFGTCSIPQRGERFQVGFLNRTCRCAHPDGLVN
jgi:hypothetical protein